MTSKSPWPRLYPEEMNLSSDPEMTSKPLITSGEITKDGCKIHFSLCFGRHTIESDAANLARPSCQHPTESVLNLSNSFAGFCDQLQMKKWVI